MSSRSSTPVARPILGYTTRLHLLLDLDNCSLDKAKRILHLIFYTYPSVGDCLIMQSSEHPITIELKYSWDGKPYIKTVRNSYHLIFDNAIGYNSCCRICETLSELRILEKDYAKIRQFRGDMTLRVSEMALSTGVKPAPIPVAFIRNPYTDRHDKLIWSYLCFWTFAFSLFPSAEVVPCVCAHGATDEPFNYYHNQGPGI